MTQDPTKALEEALALLHAGDAAQALGLIEVATKANPIAVDPYIYKGSALGMLNRPNEAVVAYQQAIMNGPTNAKGYAYLAAQYKSMGKFSEALSMAEAAFDLDRTDPMTVGILAEVRAHFQSTRPASDPTPVGHTSYHSGPASEYAQSPIAEPERREYAPQTNQYGEQQHSHASADRQRALNTREPFKVSNAIWIPYYIFAGWWFLDGLRVALASFKMANASIATGGFATVLPVNPIIVGVAGIVLMLVGLGLCIRLEVARGIANVFSFLQLGSALYGFVATFLGYINPGETSSAFLTMFAINGIIAGAQIYVIGKSDGV